MTEIGISLSKWAPTNRKRPPAKPSPSIIGKVPRPSDASSPTTSLNFTCADYTQGKVFIVSADGKVEWEHPAPSCDELWGLPNGNLLFTTGHGVKEVTREKKVVFSYESKSEIYACHWTYADHKTMRTVSSLQVLDATRGEIWH